MAALLELAHDALASFLVTQRAYPAEAIMKPFDPRFWCAAPPACDVPRAAGPPLLHARSAKGVIFDVPTGNLLTITATGVVMRCVAACSGQRHMR